VTDRASASLASSRSSRTRRSPQPASSPEAPTTAPATGTRVIAIANQKGGVGKSTTAVSLGAALADNGHRVLVVDLDPQGNASTGMGIRHEARDVTVYDVLASEAPVEAAVVPTAVRGLSAIPSTIDLAGAEIELVSQFSREAKLKKALEPLRAAHAYDFIILDCPPSLGLLTVNALTAAEELIVPIQCEYYALEGLGQLLRNVNLVQQNINPDLRLSGIVMTMFDPRTKLSEQVVAEVQRYFGDLVYDVIIPRTVRLSEAPGFGQPITEYDPKSRGAESYRRLAEEVASRPPPSGPMPVFEDLPIVSVPAAEAAEPSVPHEEEDVEEDVTPPGEAHEPQPDAVGTPPAEIEAAMDAPEPEVEAAPPPPTPARRTRPRPAPVEAELDEDLWEPPAQAATEPPAAATEPAAAPRSASEAAAEESRRVVVIDEDAADYVRPGEPGGSSPPAASPSIGATLETEDKKPRRWRLFRKGDD